MKHFYIVFNMYWPAMKLKDITGLPVIMIYEYAEWLL